MTYEKIFKDYVKATEPSTGMQMLSEPEKIAMEYHINRVKYHLLKIEKVIVDNVYKNQHD